MLMKASLYDFNGAQIGKATLPAVFDTPHRPEVIKRAVLAAQANRRQQYGADPLAGKRSSAHYHGKRKYRWTMMNREMARISRIHGKIGNLAWRARIVPQAVKGRKAHQPKAEKVWHQKINKKEKDLAIRSALAASSPIIFTDGIEAIEKTKDVDSLLRKVMQLEMERCSEKSVRPGKGKARGRKYRKKKGPVLIVSKDCRLMKSARNIPGIDIAAAGSISAELLAPGGNAGRPAILSESALAALEKKFG